MTQKIARTSKGLIDAMFDELDDLKAGKSTPQNARAKASIANTICSVTRLEMDHARFVADSRKGETQKSLEAPTLPALQMGGGEAA